VAGAAAAAAASAGEGQPPASSEEVDAAYDALQAEVAARLERERAEAQRVLELARQANRRVAGAEGDEQEEAAASDAPSAEDVARAEAIADNPWRAHRCTTPHPSDGARDAMDAAVRAHLEQTQRELEAAGGGGGDGGDGDGRHRRLFRRLLHRGAESAGPTTTTGTRALRSLTDPFDVDFTPDPYAGLPASAVAAAAERARAHPTVVRTFFHVVSPSATAGVTRGDVADATLLAQLRVLNATYAGAGFQFRLEAVTRVVSKAFSTAEVASASERAMKKALRRGGADALNIYITSPPALLGWSSFPESAREDREYDGVVIGFYTLPGSTIKPYNLGMTMAHEVGHWLGLLHTFEGQACSGLGDRVGDVSVCRVSLSLFCCGRLVFARGGRGEGGGGGGRRRGGIGGRLPPSPHNPPPAPAPRAAPRPPPRARPARRGAGAGGGAGGARAPAPAQSQGEERREAAPSPPSPRSCSRACSPRIPPHPKNKNKKTTHNRRPARRRRRLAAPRQGRSTRARPTRAPTARATSCSTRTTRACRRSRPGRSRACRPSGGSTARRLRVARRPGRRRRPRPTAAALRGSSLCRRPGRRRSRPCPSAAAAASGTTWAEREACDLCLIFRFSFFPPARGSAAATLFPRATPRADCALCPPPNNCPREQSPRTCPASLPPVYISLHS